MSEVVKRKSKAWRSSEADALVRLRAQGLSVSQIAAQIKRNRDQVLGKTFRLRGAGVIVDAQIGMGFTVLGLYSGPQSLQDIARQANRIAQQTGTTRKAAFRRAWRAAKERAGPRIPDLPPRLSQFLYHAGRLRPCSELRAIDLPLYMLRLDGLTLDYAARIATEAGYDIKDDANELVDCLSDEAMGIAHYAVPDLGLVEERTAWERYLDELERKGEPPPF